MKIMWPRDDDQRRRGRNSGFVAFMVRAMRGGGSCCTQSAAVHVLRSVRSIASWLKHYQRRTLLVSVQPFQYHCAQHGTRLQL